jgi:hypothetical protein
MNLIDPLNHRDTETQRKAIAFFAVGFLCASVSLW